MWVLPLPSQNSMRFQWAGVRWCPLRACWKPVPWPTNWLTDESQGGTYRHDNMPGSFLMSMNWWGRGAIRTDWVKAGSCWVAQETTCWCWSEWVEGVMWPKIPLPPYSEHWLCYFEMKRSWLRGHCPLWVSVCWPITLEHGEPLAGVVWRAGE
jgi:hypothetical protein